MFVDVVFFLLGMFGDELLIWLVWCLYGVSICQVILLDILIVSVCKFYWGNVLMVML